MKDFLKEHKILHGKNTIHVWWWEFGNLFLRIRYNGNCFCFPEILDEANASPDYKVSNQITQFKDKMSFSLKKIILNIFESDKFRLIEFFNYFLFYFGLICSVWRTFSDTFHVIHAFFQTILLINRIFVVTPIPLNFLKIIHSSILL